MTEPKINIALQAKLLQAIKKVFHLELVKMAFVHDETEPSGRRCFKDDKWHTFARVTSIELDSERNRGYFLVDKEGRTQERKLHLKVNLEIARKRLRKNPRPEDFEWCLSESRDLVVTEKFATISEFVKRIQKALRRGMLLFNRGCCSPSGLLMQTMTKPEIASLRKQILAQVKDLNDQIDSLRINRESLVQMGYKLET